MDLIDFNNQTSNSALICPNASVLITLNENSIGSRACCGVIGGQLGFDWEFNQFRIEPELPLVKDILDRDTPQNKIQWLNIFYCPRCDLRIDATDKYCRRCGQALKYFKK